MATKIYMPALSPTMTEGSLTKWLVNVGDRVKAGDIIAEIETDKATMEVESVDEGVVTKLLFKEGSTAVPVNTTIAILDGDDEITEKNDINITQKIKVNKVNDEKIIKKVNDNNEFVEKTNNVKILNRNYLNKKILTSPYVRSTAKKNHIILENISGSGPDGRIIKRDLNNENKKSLDTNNIYQDFVTPSSMRKIIAEKTTITKQTVPHFYLTIESNVDQLIEMRKKINVTSDFKLSINDIIVKALAQAQKLNPLTNVSWIDDKIVKHKNVDISIAVALDEGLITPIVKNADTKGLKEISQEIKYLIDKAKNGKLTPDEYNGGTISISNLGMFGISEFSAIINPPQSSILAVGAINKIPRVLNNEIKAINILKSTLSADHRVLDGAVAGKLLKDFNDILEDPFNLWLISNDMGIM